MVQCLLTRRCNLGCDYCCIAGNMDYKGKPNEYPDKNTHLHNEKSADYWIDILSRYHKHSPDTYFILWGGEPFLVKDKLTAIVRHLNQLKAGYTISTNASKGKVQKAIKVFFRDVGKVNGFSVSIDPGFERNDVDGNKDEYKKSRDGIDIIQHVIKNNLALDPSAVMTLSRENALYAPATMKYLTDRGISVFLNLLSTQKNPYYDFPGKGTWHPCEPNDDTRRVFDALRQFPEAQHTTKGILDDMFDILPENFDCEIERDLHNITIEPDGALRMCCNIRGVSSPKNRTEDILGPDGHVIEEGMGRFKASILDDKNRYCRGCALTCMMMSKLQSAKAIKHV